MALTNLHVGQKYALSIPCYIKIGFGQCFWFQLKHITCNSCTWCARCDTEYDFENKCATG